ncbi:MAG: tetratricopeptide repeat protein [Candidatus Heimdallarchaeota archaeon]|nr:tetratricopeptide repeat protein [Candidatus Heimdallarchaeota archaeon]
MSKLGSDNLISILQKISELADQGHLDDSILFITEFEKSNPNYHTELESDQNTYFDYQLKKSFIWEKKGELDKALELAISTYEESISKENSIKQVESLIAWATQLWRMGKYDKAEAQVKSGIKIWEATSREIRSEHQEVYAKFLNTKGIVHRFKGELGPALTCFLEAVEYYRTVENEPRVSILMHNIGMIHHDTGDLESAIHALLESLEIEQSIGNNQNIAETMTSISLVYNDFGKIYESIDYLEQSLIIMRALGDKVHTAHILNILAKATRDLGQMEKCLVYLLEAYKLRKEVGDPTFLSFSLKSIGNAYADMKDFQKARNYVSQAIEIFKDIGNDIFLSGAIFSLIEIYLDSSDASLDEKISELYHSLVELNERNTNLKIDHRTRMANAIILKSKKRITHKIEAQKILQVLVKEEVVEFHITITAMFYLSELLLEELKSYGEEEVLQEAIALSNRMFVEAEKYHSYMIQAEVRMIQAKFALVNGDLASCDTLLQEALDISESWKLTSIADKIKTEQKAIELELHKWDQMTSENSSIIKRLEQSRIEELVSKLFDVPT